MDWAKVCASVCVPAVHAPYAVAVLSVPFLFAFWALCLNDQPTVCGLTFETCGPHLAPSGYTENWEQETVVERMFKSITSAVVDHGKLSNSVAFFWDQVPHTYICMYVQYIHTYVCMYCRLYVDNLLTVYNTVTDTFTAYMRICDKGQSILNMFLTLDKENETVNQF